MNEPNRKPWHSRVPAWAWVVGIPVAILLGITACVAAIVLAWPYAFSDQ